jgi:hypothetical protein
MRATRSPQAAAERLAYCCICRGVLPFDEARCLVPLRLGMLTLGSLPRRGLRCRRCRREFHAVDLAATGRRRAARYGLYAALGGVPALLVGGAAAALGPDYPLLTWRDAGAAWLLGVLALACLARCIVLGLEAARYQRVEASALLELDRSLCPGMIRSDVVDALARRGYSPGQIRSVIERLRPASRAA